MSAGRPGRLVPPARRLLAVPATRRFLLPPAPVIGRPIPYVGSRFGFPTITIRFHRFAPAIHAGSLLGLKLRVEATLRADNFLRQRA
ncbi:hypothetical protein [Salinispora oceanensis]|uniref:hypothetical protein n=1 Tax=Salinispora oceanensis TaxID=1050199 RepID=UPI000380B1EB|nr:hypothetical protein [Salinispora oceanensis]